jgi:hypothetical protein
LFRECGGADFPKPDKVGKIFQLFRELRYADFPKPDKEEYISVVSGMELRSIPETTDNAISWRVRSRRFIALLARKQLEALDIKPLNVTYYRKWQR